MLNNLTKKINNLSSKKKIKIGWFDSEQSMIAAVMENGAVIQPTNKMKGWFSQYDVNKSNNPIVIPARPHKQKTIFENKFKWIKDFKTSLYDNNFDLDKSLNELGPKFVEDYKNIFSSGEYQKLSQFTLMMRDKKGISGDKPLLATGELMNNISFKVDK
ncbi:hypothetical protein [Francisella tularensis]|uniref:hypothetical protein n=1 Tax=Francisella tularensis TaxID=263 RepID=UPI0008F469CE|nr:hypothetical protein [Francisella tularensis]APA83224.1 hypothetical protein N894_1240 [Francisella tularensis subsp. novicida PA10-7858]